MIALIDGDIIAYRCSSSCEPTRAKALLEPFEDAIRRADELLNRILQETGATSYRLFLGGSENFRYKIDPNYKANRANKPKPTWLQDVRAFLVTDWNAEICDGIEADDALGIEQYSLVTNVMLFEKMDVWERHYNSITCSIDKDLLQLEGWHYNFVKMEKIFVDEMTGIKNFYQQLIQGDQSDNIMGYDGKARLKIPQFLQPKIDELWSCTTESEMLELVRNMYNDDERLLRNGQLLWIMRKEKDIWKLPQTQ